MSSTRTRTIGIGLALAALLTAGRGTSAMAAPPLADRVPEGSLIYLGWGGRSLTFDGSVLGQFLAEPFVKDVLAAVHQAAESETRDEGDRAIFNHLWTMGSIAWRHPAALALFEIIPPAENARGRREPRPVGALVIDLQKDRPAFATELQGLLTAAGKKLEISQAAAGEVTYSRFDTEGGPCGIGFVGDLFFMTIGEKAPETVVALAGGKARALSANPGFAAAMKEVAGDSAQFAWYVDVAGAVKTMERLVPPAKEPGEKTPLARTLDAMGLDRATAAVGAVNIVDRGCYEKIRLLSPAPHRGLLAVPAGEPLAATAMTGAPADADLAIAARSDPSALLAELRRSLAALDPELPKQLDEGLRAAGEQLEIDLEKDLLAALGDQWTLVSAASLGGVLTGTALTVDLKDPAKAAEAVARIEAVLEKSIGRPASEGGRARGLGLRTLNSGELTVRYVAAIGRADTMPVAPAWAIQKNRLIVAAWPQIVVAVADKPGKSLADQPAFVALRKRVGATPSILAYINGPAMLRRFYGVALAGWTAGSNELAREFGPLLDPGRLPALPALSKYASEGIAAAGADAKGVTIEAYGSMPGSSLMVIASPLQSLAVTGSAATLGLARPRAREAALAADLNMIGRACVVYAVDNKEQFPPDLESLVEGRLVTEQFLKRDRGGKMVYLGALVTMAAPADLMVAYFQPDGPSGGKVLMLRTDGGVNWLTQEAFQKELTRARQYVKDQGK